jgi:hypothetical protein
LNGFNGLNSLNSLNSWLIPAFVFVAARHHEMLVDLAAHLENGTELRGVQAEQLLQGPFADAMTHAGQLALLRRLAGAPVPPENFIVADIRPERLGQDQPMPVSPDTVWPEAPPSWVPPERN